MPVKKILIQKEKKAFIKEKNRTFTVSKQRFFNLRSVDQDFHTQAGVIAKVDINKKSGSTIFSSKKKEFITIDPLFIDQYRNMKRGAQIIPTKDIAYIIAETGLNKDSVVLDAGSGSGAVCCFLANIVKKVITYEVRPDFANIVRHNIKELALNNVMLKLKNIYNECEEPEQSVDVVIFDLPEPWEGLKTAQNILKVGGFLISYSPSVPQVADFVNVVKKNNSFIHLKTVEIIQREWDVDERKVRPKSEGIGHSGYLTFARKVSQQK